MQLLFVTRNKNKIKEIKALTKDFINIESLDSIEFYQEIPENEPTIKENASFKARFIYDLKRINCFADDSGLEVEALNGMPGVFSARYGGEEKNDLQNIKKLLSDLKNKDNRRAKFVTVISLIIDGKEKLFEGTVEGEIIDEPRGNKGFGYDPVFIPDGYDKTFAEMELEDKNKISHRSIAIRKFLNYLERV